MCSELYQRIFLPAAEIQDRFEAAAGGAQCIINTPTELRPWYSAPRLIAPVLDAS